MTDPTINPKTDNLSNNQLGERAVLFMDEHNFPHRGVFQVSRGSYRPDGFDTVYLRSDNGNPSHSVDFHKLTAAILRVNIHPPPDNGG